MKKLMYGIMTLFLMVVLSGIAMAGDPYMPSKDRKITLPAKSLLPSDEIKKLQKQKEIRPKITPNLQSFGCPDPAIVRVSYIVDDRYGDRTRYTVWGTVRNKGVAPFISRPNQQEIHLIEKEFDKPDRVVLTQRFQNLRPGQEVRISYSTHIDVGGPYIINREYHAMIVYDPDILNDGNPKNDDCKSNNNKGWTIVYSTSLE